MKNIKRFNESVGSEHVKVFACLHGVYCAFHEMTLSVIYDITNDKSVGMMYNEETMEEMENWSREDRLSKNYDIKKLDAVLVNGIYYIKPPW